MNVLLKVSHSHFICKLLQLPCFKTKTEIISISYRSLPSQSSFRPFPDASWQVGHQQWMKISKIEWTCRKLSRKQERNPGKSLLRLCWNNWKDVISIHLRKRLENNTISRQTMPVMTAKATSRALLLERLC